MRQDERDALRRLFRFRCGYCGVGEGSAGAELTVDHFQPQTRGGSDEPDNWVYCCHACNSFKGDYWQPDSTNRVLHPLRDGIVAHLVELADGTLRALTDNGAFQIQRLHLNRQQLVAFRCERRLLEATRHENSRLLIIVQQLEDELHALISALEQFEAQKPDG